MKVKFYGRNVEHFVEKKNIYYLYDILNIFYSVLIRC